MSLYFTYESRGTPKLFTLFITVKLSLTKLNLGHIEKFKTLVNKLVLVVHVLRLTTQNFQVGHFKRTRRQRQRELHQPKLGLMSRTKLCTCVIILGAFFSRPLQKNNVKLPNYALTEERERQRLIFRISSFGTERIRSPGS